MESNKFQNIKHFKWEEFKCKCDFIECEFQTEEQVKKAISYNLLVNLDKLRSYLGFPLKITSGLRCKHHPIAAKKKSPGAHQQGKAVDIAVAVSATRFKILQAALNTSYNFLGIGISKNFVHLDVGHDTAPRPAIWTY